jgi:hypothetical protein
MARKNINIGLTGNDGTGDSIRDAFSKVNENFRELYASQGLEEGLTFENLVDVVKPLRPNGVLSLNSLGNNVISKELVGSANISIDTATDPSKISLSLTGISISLDPTPTLSNTLNAGGFKVSNMAAPQADNDAVTRRWVYSNFLNRDNEDLTGTVNAVDGSTMRDNFKIQPAPNNGNPNLGERFIPLLDSDGLTPKTNVFLKFQGTDPAHSVRKDYADSKISLAGTLAVDPETGLTDRGFGVMTGPLILNDHPGEYQGIELSPKEGGPAFVQEDYRAATKGYVDSKSYSSPTNIYVSTIGNDDMWDFDNDTPNPDYGYPEYEIGRSWSKAFKSVRAALKFAKKYIDRVTLQTTPYKVSTSQVFKYIPALGTELEYPRTKVRVSLQNHGYQDGDYVQVSGAVLLGAVDTRELNGIFRVNRINANLFELNLKKTFSWVNPVVDPLDPFITIALANKKDGPYSTLSRVDLGFRGFFIPKPEITVMIESGVYFEEFPIIVPPNVAIKGDEFRRTLIKPKQGPVPAENINLKFVRGDRSLNANFWYNNHYYRQLGRSVGATNIVNSTRLEIRDAAYPPKSGMRFIVGSTGGVPNVYRVGPVRKILYKTPNPDLNIAPGTYTMDIVDENGDLKPLAQSIPDNTLIEFFLDNEHADMLLVNDAFQARNITFVGSKGFVMAFDPNGQILTRSPYAQVCSTFSGEGGGGQLIDGMAGNQLCYVDDTTYTDPFTGTLGASGTKMRVTGLVRKPEVPNTFYLSKKRYVIIDTTEVDQNGSATLTLSSAPGEFIELDDTFLPAGFIPNGTQILIETAGNRSMLSNDFTMINDLGYGIYVDNNGVCEAVSQFTYYCRVGYLSKAGGQIRSVTGSSCYGIIGLQSEGSDPNEAIQIGRLRTPVMNLITPYIDDPINEGRFGAVSFYVGNADCPPLRNATFKLTAHEIAIKDIRRARLSGGTLTTGPLKVTTYYRHPFKTGEEVQITGVKTDAGLNLPPTTPGGNPLPNDISGNTYTVTILDEYNFTLDETESSDYWLPSEIPNDSTTHINDLIKTAFSYNESPVARQSLAPTGVLVQDRIYSISGNASEDRIAGVARFDGVAGENQANQNTLKVIQLRRPAVKNMKFTLGSTVPAVVSNDIQVYTVTNVVRQDVTFKVNIRLVEPLGVNDNKIGATEIYITEVKNEADPSVIITDPASPWAPKAGWSFQLLDPALNETLNYTRYTIKEGTTPTYDAVEDRWLIELDLPLTVNMVNQIATAKKTRVDGIWDLTLDRPLSASIPNTTPIRFFFYDSYWRINLDPSLSNDLPFYAPDAYNKPQPKPLVFAQTKTISVSQIRNVPPIINSSAMKFSETNFDPSIYRILGKTETPGSAGITKDSYPLAVTANPLVGFNVEAVTKLVANKSFIQREVINFLNEIYPDFVYNQITCSRDVGLIIDAVAYDLTYGGNVRSRAAGIAYYQQGNVSAATVLSQQKTETIDAINFATTVALTALNVYSGSTPSQTALPYEGTRINASEQILANKDFIVEDTIRYLNILTQGTGFTYNETLWRSKFSTIVESLAYDLEYEANVKTRYTTLKFYDGTPESIFLLAEQKSQMIAAINHIRTISKLIVLESTVTPQAGNLLPQDTDGTAGVSGIDDSTVETLMTLITTALQSGSSTIPARNLGIRRSYQDPTAGGYSPQIIDNNLEAETGSATKVGELMDQIVRIINLGERNPAGVISDIVISDGGAGYNDNTPPTLLIAAPSSGSNRATATVTVQGGVITDVTITNPGSGYDFVPTVTIVNGGSNSPTQVAQLTALLSVSLHINVQPQVLDTLQSLTFPATATGLQYGAVLSGPGIPYAGDPNGTTQNTFIRTVTQEFNQDGTTSGYEVRISSIITQSIPAGTEISITGPGSNYLFDLNTALDIKHQPGDVIGITTTFSTVRATGHDFLQVGAGGFDDSNYPNNVYGQPEPPGPSPSAIVKEIGTGRVFHVSTDQDGNFRVGTYFNVNQGDGTVNIAARIGLSGVSSLSFAVGETVDNFSADTKMDAPEDTTVSTQKAIVTYINNIINGFYSIDGTETPQKGLMRLDGASIMQGNMQLGSNSIETLRNSEDVNGTGAVNRKYVDNVFAGGTVSYGEFGTAYILETTGRRTDVFGFSMIQDLTDVGGVFRNRGGISLNNNKITLLKTPTQAGDATNKSYVDQAIATGGVRTGWSGFTLANTTQRYKVQNINVNQNGSGYTTAPVVTIVSSSGTGASARAVLSSGAGPTYSVASIVVDDPGYNYIDTPTVIIGGSVREVQLLFGGLNYNLPPILTFSPPQTVGGITATGYAIMEGQGDNKRIKEVVVVNGGSGYTIPPSITQTYSDTVAGRNPATFLSVLNAGSGAVATAVTSAVPRNIDLNGNKITGSGLPTATSDLINKQFFDTNNYIGKINDVEIVGNPGLGDLLVFTGQEPDENSSGSMTNVSISTESDIVSTVTLTEGGNSITFTYRAGSITNADVASSAGIAQTKLSLNRSNTIGQDTTGLTSEQLASRYGIAAFKETQFNSDNGFISIRDSSSTTDGITFSQLRKITNKKILGYYNSTQGDTDTGNIAELSAQNVRDILGLSTETVATIISDDTLGGLEPTNLPEDSNVNRVSTGLATRKGGATSYGALLKVGGRMRGRLTFDSALPSGDPSITPIINVEDTDKYDIGTSTKKFKTIHSTTFEGTNFNGTRFGRTTAPTNLTEANPHTFYGIASYADKVGNGGLAFSLSAGTDITIVAGTTSTSFNGSQSCTIAVSSSTDGNNSLLAKRNNGVLKATTFEGDLDGVADTSKAVRIGTTDYLGSTGASANTVAIRDGNQDIYANEFKGTALKAKYADLAERYQADNSYEPGTVLEFGGDHEVTLAREATRKIAGIVSTKPAFEMNTVLEGDNVVSIALQGRVPCKVVGKIEKGDLMISAGNGFAKSSDDPKLGSVIGKALQNWDGGEGIIEIVVGRL